MDISASNTQSLLNEMILSNTRDEILETLRQGTNVNYLDTLSTLALDPRYTSIIFITHRDLFVEICSRWMKSLPPDGAEESLAVVAALARILPAAPYLSVYVKELLHLQQFGILQVFKSRRVTALAELPHESLHSLLLALYRLLRFDNESFAAIISPAQLQLLLSHIRQDIRYLTIRIFCLYLHASDLAMEQMLKRFCSEEAIIGEWEDKMIDYAFLTLWEEKRVKQLIQKPGKSQFTTQNESAVLPAGRTIEKNDLSHITACMGNVLIPRLGGGPKYVSSIVTTDTFDHNMRLFANAINEEKPLLVTGLSGSGKTFLINEFAKQLGKRQSMVSLYLNEQTDIKLLIGMHTSVNTPGSFAWQPGVLTKAVVEGRWLLIEGLDRAPTETLSTLLPLLERQELFIPHWGDTVRAAPGFKIIATIRTNMNMRGEETMSGTNILGIRHWLRVSLSMPTNEELTTTMTSRFPILCAHISRIIKIYCSLTESDSGQSMNQKIIKEEHFRPQLLFRLCKRLEHLIITAGITSSNELISEALNDMMFLETADCFASFSPGGTLKSYIVDVISQGFNVHPDRANFCLKIRSPEYEIDDTRLLIGRTSILRTKSQYAKHLSQRPRKAPFAFTNSVLRVLESVAVAITMAEPCLLIGETGTGKTTLIQHLADTLGYRLTVVNLSQQSEVSDLLGGYKPLNLRALAVPLKEEFEDLFESTFSSKRNQHYIDAIGKAVLKSRWPRALALWQEALQMAENTFKILGPHSSAHLSERQPKRRKLDTSKFQTLKQRWNKFSSDLGIFSTYVSGSTTVSLLFVEGNIVKAARDGDWVLLDEINLASPDTLESLADLICDGFDVAPTLLLSDKGDTERIHAHRNFRIFGAMNPATDIGKKNLPMSLRKRFTEIFIDPPDTNIENLTIMVKAYLGNYVNTNLGIASSVAQLYLKIKQLSNENKIVDGTNQKPLFSLRTLTRTLVYVTDLSSIYGLQRAFFEGFSMTFLTPLNKDSELLVLPLIKKQFLSSLANTRALLSQPLQPPQGSKKYVQFGHYWVARGDAPIQNQPRYVITPFIEQNLLKLVRAISTRRFPLLLQGPTSSGKTSMIEYLARVSGNTFIRINNHEHTDIQEYLGSHVSGVDGRLEYQEGILVRALREGYWLVLDELNLAPTDVLEALNRLLDDNKELLIPETQQLVRPHDNFVLFATQNPPGTYGGRKILSRAFRNRFLELHFADIPEDELQTILQKRSQIAPSFCTKIVAVYKQLSILRQKDRLFEQRNSFATLRDLFRWALRDADNREQLAINGLFLLAERVRNMDERSAVKNIIQNVMKVELDEKTLYGHRSPLLPLDVCQPWSQGIVWTKSMRRLCILVTQALRRNEPVLLVGETGSGKTTICQIVSELLGTKLYTVNAHQNMETGDLIGAQRPIRNRAAIETNLTQEIMSVLTNNGIYEKDNTADLPTLLEAYEALLRRKDISISSESSARIQKYRTQSKALFEWSDGSLVTAMREGQHFLLDEISLADDSVLERLNSVLESDRTLFLAEKGSTDTLVTASQGFQFLATMNPGGDYGKRELSPALRNRFTEIWVPQTIDHDEIMEIVLAKISPLFLKYAAPMVTFAMWYNAKYDPTAPAISIRNILAWTQFINICESGNPYFAILHGAAMVYIDGLGANPAAKISIPESEILTQRRECLCKLEKLFQHDMLSLYSENQKFSLDNHNLTLGTFALEVLNTSNQKLAYSLEAPTTKANAMKLLRALKLQKPILLEGSPGVGKTTLVVALAQATGNVLTRINLSDQTDLTDLFGSDVPLERAEAGHFGWRDAPFLQAMQNGNWVLLDEMNLASQAVLEGLNACFDHRGQIYVSELDQTFTKHPKFTVFAAQNPHHQGGGRKGLPASFVNRFTIVYADGFTPDDLLIISNQSHPDCSIEITKSLITCVTETSRLLQTHSRSGMRGGPWEINLRDLLRWGDLLTSRNSIMGAGSAADYQDLLFLQRFRTSEDVAAVSQPFNKYLPQDQRAPGSFYNMSSSYLQVGHVLMAKEPLLQPIFDSHVKPIAANLGIIESVLFCIQNSWPCLLVGSSGCGKSRLLFQVASKIGAEIVNLSLNADMDIIDLIGGYEQADVQREIINIVKRLKKLIQKQTVQKLVSSSKFEMAFTNLEEVIQSSVPEPRELYKLIRELKNDERSPEILSIIKEIEHLNRRSLNDNRGRFEWSDGILIKALQRGQWLVLDNANLCPSSILDRLNSLLEPNGFLVVNEHLLPDGSVPVVKPHPSFRIFLTMDPRHGELSRSMRNRCVELFVSVSSGLGKENSFRSTCEPSVSRFQLFSDINWSSYNYSQFLSLSAIFFDHLTIEDYRLVHRWQEEVLKGLVEVSPAMQEIFVSNMKVRRELLNSNGAIILGIRGIYDRVSNILGTKSQFSNMQIINPLVNPSVISLATQNNLPDLKLFGLYFELVLDIYDFNAKLGSISKRLQSKSVSQMSRLERSYSASKSGHFKFESTRPLWGFLEDVAHFVLSFVDGKDCGAQGGMNDVLSYARYILSYLKDMVDLTMSPDFDEGVFQAYLMVGRSIVVDSGDKAQLRRLADKFSDGLSAFNASWQLSTGLSMETLWRLLRPPLAKNIAQLECGLQVEKLADQFDTLKWTVGASIQELDSFRRSMILFHNRMNVFETHDDESLRDVQKSFEEFGKRLQSSSYADMPHFAKQFEIMCQYEAAVYLNEPMKPLSILDLLAVRPTKLLMDSDHLSSAWVLLSKIEGFSGIGNPSTALATLRNTFMPSMLSAMENISNVPLRCLASLRGEMNLMTENLIRLSTSISNSQFRVLNTILTKTFITICEAHADFLDPLSLEICVARLNSYDQMPIMDSSAPLLSIKSNDSELYYFKLAIEKYINPSLLNLYKGLNRPSEPSVATSLAWIQLFTGCLYLYVPDRPFDPALKPVVEQNRHKKRKNELVTKLQALRVFEQIFTGQDSSLRSQIVEKQLREVGDEPRVFIVPRPQVSKLDQLQGELNNVLKFVLFRSPNTSDLEQLMHGDPTKLREMENLRLNIAQSIDRLTAKFRIYDDITKPLVVILQGLDTGLALILQISYPETAQSSIAKCICESTPFLGMQPHYLSTTRFHDFQFHQQRDYDPRIFFLKTVASSHSVGLKVGHSTAQVVSEVFQGFYEDWKAVLQIDRQKDAAKSSMYRYRGGEEDIVEADEEEFLSLFPDFVSKTEDLDRTDETRYDQKKLAQVIANHQKAIFKGDGSTSNQILSMLQSSSEEIGRLWPGESSTIKYDLPAENMMCGLILCLSKRQDQLNGCSTKSHNSNFYLDSNIIEAQKLVNIVREIQARFQDLAEAWPEHASIQDVLQTSSELMAMRHSEPIAKLLTKVEQLYGFVHEWQAVTSKQYTAVSIYEQLTTLIIDWRRLELSTWARILDMEVKKCNDDADSWWFMAYEVIIAAPLSIVRSGEDLQQYGEQLFSTLGDFLITTSIGQFFQRLQLVECFQMQVELLAKEIPALNVVQSTLINFLSYYSRFVETIHETLRKSRQTLDNDMKEVLLLASWKDTNINALRESAKRSHHKLFKIVRKFRAILAQPAEKYIMHGMPERSENVDIPVYDASMSEPQDVDQRAFRICQQHISNWASKPRRFSDPLSTARNMVHISQMPSIAVDSASYLGNFIDDIIGNIKLLQKETPLKEIKDNHQAQKHLKYRKQKLFADTLKKIRYMGFQSNLNIDALTRQSSLGKVLASFLAMPVGVVQLDLDAAEFELHCLLHQMSEVRQQIRNHSTDLSPRDVTRCVGFLEDILNKVIKQRGTLTGCASNLQSLDKTIKSMQNIGLSETYDVVTEETNGLAVAEELKNLIAWLPGFLDVGVTIIEKYDELGGLDSSSAIEALKSKKSKVRDVDEAYRNLPKIPSGLSSSLHKETDSQAIDTLADLSATIIDLKKKFPNLSFVLKQLEMWVKSDFNFPRQQMNQKCAISLTQFDESLSQVLDSILVTTQRVSGVLASASISQEDSGWVMQTDSVLARCIRLFHARKIGLLLQEKISKMCHLESNGKDGIIVMRALCAVAMPIIQQYRNLLQVFFDNYTRFHRFLCKLARVSAQSFCQVSSQGFCNPADHSKADPEKSENLEEGTGLGEGEGAQDISKDIGIDEDLSELAQDAKKEKDKAQIDDEEDAVDMNQEELEGDTGEASNNPEDTDSESEGDGTDLDEETGSVDDLDPSAIDEKLWDGNKDDANKDKEGSQVKGNRSKNQQMAADTDKNENSKGNSDDEADEMNDEGAEEGDQVAHEQTENLDTRAEVENPLELPDSINLGHEDYSMSESETDDVDDPPTDEDDISEKQGASELDDDSQCSKTSDEYTERHENKALEEELNEEMDEDVNEKNDAASPVDTEPERIEENSAQGLLHDNSRDSNVGRNNDFLDDAQGLGEDGNQTNDQKNQSSDAQGNADSQGGTLNLEHTKSIADEGQNGETGHNSKEMQNQNIQSDKMAAGQVFKKLGDALEKWHRQQQEIKAPQESPGHIELDPAASNLGNQEFEHLGDEEAKADTQALGVASEDQAHALDARAYESQMQDQVSDFMPDEPSVANPENEDQLMADFKFQGQQENTQEKSKPGAMIVENSIRESLFHESKTESFEEQGKDIEELDSSLSVTHLHPPTSLGPLSTSEALLLWTRFESITHPLSLILTEQLRLILAPTLATKMRGDFRTGKRLNIKRIIPYIASNYRRDKIWMRRTVPSKRAYQILLAVDDSKSMSESSGGHLAFETLALIAKSLSMLEVGQICIVGFGTDVHVAHNFDEPFSSDAGAAIFQQFRFQQPKTNVKKLLQETNALFHNARNNLSQAHARDLWQLQLIISDGVCEDHDAIRQLVRQSQEARIVIVFVIVDAGKGESILDMNQAVFEPEDGSMSDAPNKLKIKRYLDGFPFPYYLVVGDVRELPDVLSTALRQWFAEVVESG